MRVLSLSMPENRLWLAVRSLGRMTITVLVVAPVFATVVPLHPVTTMPSVPPPPILVATPPVLTPILILLSERNCTSVGIQRNSKLAQAEHASALLILLVTYLFPSLSNVQWFRGALLSGSFFIHKYDESNNLSGPFLSHSVRKACGPARYQETTSAAAKSRTATTTSGRDNDFRHRRPVPLH